MVEAVRTDVRTAQLPPADRSMLDFVIKLTLTPSKMTREDVLKLRKVGFEDGAIFDIVQITSLFAYYNRVADGLGLESEPEWSEPLDR